MKHPISYFYSQGSNSPFWPWYPAEVTSIQPITAEMFLQKVTEISVLQLLGRSQTPFHVCIFSLGYNNAYSIFLAQIIKKSR